MNAYQNRTGFVILILVILGLLIPQIAHAQDIEVNAADPSSAEQGTFGLDVKITGNGFAKGAMVRFFLFETEEDGGIVVNSVKARGSKSLIVNIDVLDDAIIDDFNVEVELLNGRKGKGTARLFAVKAKQEDTPGGEHRNLRVTFDDFEFDNVQSVGGPYSDSEKEVYARLGGQTQPNKPGFRVELKKSGRNPRELAVNFTCLPLPGEPDNCDLLPSNPLFETGTNLQFSLRPYEVNCPEPPYDDCPDVFTMGTGMSNSEYMSFRVGFISKEFVIEVRSAIGGADGPNPGRCLSLLSEDARSAFLEFCADPADCNVLVEAFDDGDLDGAGAGDGENDEWRIDASGVVALICNIFKPGFVYGMTTDLTFGVTAIKE